MQQILFVAGLNPSTRARDLAEVFERFGPIERCDVVPPSRPNPWNKTNPYAFVEFKSQRDAHEALSRLNRTYFDDYMLKISWATHPPSHTFNKTYPQRRANRSRSQSPSRNDNESDKPLLHGKLERHSYLPQHASSDHNSRDDTDEYRYNRRSYSYGDEYRGDHNQRRRSSREEYKAAGIGDTLRYNDGPRQFEPSVRGHHHHNRYNTISERPRPSRSPHSSRHRVQNGRGHSTRGRFERRSWIRPSRSQDEDPPNQSSPQPHNQTRSPLPYRGRSRTPATMNKQSPSTDYAQTPPGPPPPPGEYCGSSPQTRSPHGWSTPGRHLPEPMTPPGQPPGPEED
ncbi:hypothetical protein BDP27DRAFT_1416302 [Rhodocollybia butyracea]|uniref:RRM domain-containing protein n=1 Tax=Rhodocollybia butyracea TaxID=206335 RepID=A0A9P5UCR7_9AGAR|nr:hypothetical protein BDP27DRAFT_1416302 [Rhodocollybia butyracea]